MKDLPNRFASTEGFQLLRNHVAAIEETVKELPARLGSVESHLEDIHNDPKVTNRAQLRAVKEDLLRRMRNLAGEAENSLSFLEQKQRMLLTLCRNLIFDDLPLLQERRLTPTGRNAALAEDKRCASCNRPYDKRVGREYVKEIEDQGFRPTISVPAGMEGALENAPE